MLGLTSWKLALIAFSTIQLTLYTDILGAAARPGNVFSSKSSRKEGPVSLTTVVPRPAPPPLPPSLLISKIPVQRLQSYVAMIPSKLRQIPQYYEVFPEAEPKRADITTMLDLADAVHEQMASSSSSKKQYLPLLFDGNAFGVGIPRKVYAMPLDHPNFYDFNNLEFADKNGKQMLAILGVWHDHPMYPQYEVGAGPRVDLYGFAEVTNAENLHNILTGLSDRPDLAHNLYRVLSIFP